MCGQRRENAIWLRPANTTAVLWDLQLDENWNIYKLTGYGSIKKVNFAIWQFKNRHKKVMRSTEVATMTVSIELPVGCRWNNTTLRYVDTPPLYAQSKS